MQKTCDSPCSDGEAGQTHHIHTSETHENHMIMLNNCRFLKYHILEDTYIAYLFDLEVKSLYKCGHVLVCPMLPAVEKPLSIVLSHLQWWMIV